MQILGSGRKRTFSVNGINDLQRFEGQLQANSIILTEKDESFRLNQDLSGAS